MPEFGERLATVMSQSKRDRFVDQVDVTVAGTERNFAVQVTRETGKANDHSFVITFDDITQVSRPPSAPPPGRMWPAASLMRSEIH